MAQVRLVQIGPAQPGTNIQIGGIGRTLTASPAGTNIQLARFTNQTGTFYKDPTNTAGGNPGQPIQVGTALANRTLGYIVGTGAPTATLINTQTAAGAGYFSIWNTGIVQGGFQIQVPNAGQQAKAQGSISNQPAVNQAAFNQNQPFNSVNQAPKNQNQPFNSVNQAPKNQNQPFNSVNQAAFQQNQPAVNQPAYNLNQPFNQFNQNFYQYDFRFDGRFYPGTHIHDPDVHQNQPFNQTNQPAVNQPAVSVNQAAINQNQPSNSVNQAAVQQNQPSNSVNQAAINQNQPLSSVNQAAINQPIIQNPSANQPAVGTLYNGYWLNTAPGGTIQNAGGFTISIGNIGTLTTVGGAFSGTGVSGSFQGLAPTYTRTASAAVTTQQGIVNFQGTTRN